MKTTHLQNKFGIGRRPMFRQLSCMVFLGAFLASPLWAQSKDLSYSVRLGGISGAYDTDLEPRWRGDLLFGSLLGGGFGISTAWENKSAGGASIGGSIYYKDFEFFLDSRSVSASPSWTEFQSLPVSGGSMTSIYSMNMDISRGDVDLGGQYTFFKKDAHSFSGKIFRRSRMISGDLGGIGIYSVSSASILSVRGGAVDARASGLGYGLGYAYHLQEHEFRVGLSVYGLNGSWDYSQNYLSAFSLLFVSENGDYKISGSILDLGYRYQFAKSWRFFVNYSQDTATATDSDVVNLSLNLTLGTTITLKTDYNVLTYLGSSAEDSLSTVELGVEYLF